MLLRTALTALALALVVPATAHAVAWQSYVNERFGSTADVPADWQAGEPPANGDGLRFTSPDGQAWIIVSGSLQVADTISEAIALIEAPNEGEQITYHHRESRLVIVSGLKRERIFYRKSILSCRDRVWNSIAIEYPAARKQAFDGIVVHAARSLKAGRSAQVAECNGQASLSPVTLISTGTLRRSDQPQPQAAGTSRNLTRQASIEPETDVQGSEATSTGAPQDQDMQRSDDMQSSHSDM